MKQFKKVFSILAAILVPFNNMTVFAQEADPFQFEIHEFEDYAISLEYNETITFTPECEEDAIAVFSSLSDALDITVNDISVMDEEVSVNQSFTMTRTSASADVLTVNVKHDGEIYVYQYKVPAVEDPTYQPFEPAPEVDSSNYKVNWSGESTVLLGQSTTIESKLFNNYNEELAYDSLSYVVTGCDYRINNNAITLQATALNPITIEATYTYGTDTITDTFTISVTEEYYNASINASSLFIEKNHSDTLIPSLTRYYKENGMNKEENITNSITKVEYTFDDSVALSNQKGNILSGVETTKDAATITKLNNKETTVSCTIYYMVGQREAYQTLSCKISSISSIQFHVGEMTISEDTPVQIYDQNNDLVNPEDVTFTSSHSEVSVVKNGMFVANHTGSTTITATAYNSSSTINIYVKPSTTVQDTFYITYVDENGNYVGDATNEVDGLTASIQSGSVDSFVRSHISYEVNINTIGFYSVLGYSYRVVGNNVLVEASVRKIETDLYPDSEGNKKGTLTIDYYNQETNQLISTLTLNNINIASYSAVRYEAVKNAPFYVNLDLNQIQYGMNQNGSRSIIVRLEQSLSDSKYNGHATFIYVLYGNPNYELQRIDVDNVPLNDCLEYAKAKVMDGYTISSYIEQKEIESNNGQYSRTFILHCMVNSEPATVNLSQSTLRSYFNMDMDILYRASIQYIGIDSKVDQFNLSAAQKEIKCLFGIQINAWIYNYLYHIGDIGTLAQNVAVTIPVPSIYTNGQSFEIAIINNGTIRYVTPTSTGDGLHYTFYTNAFTQRNGDEFSQPYFAIVQKQSDKVDVQYVYKNNVIKTTQISKTLANVESYFRSNVPSGYEYASSTFTGGKWLVNINKGNPCGEDSNWNYENGTLTISGTGNMENYTSTTVPWKNYKNSIQHIVVDEGITSVGSYAFHNATSTKDISLPDSLRTINAYAFTNCSNASLAIPKNVNRIEVSAIQGIQRISVSSQNTVYDSRNSCNALIESRTNTLLYATNNMIKQNTIEVIGSQAYRSCTFETISIPASVHTIQDEGLKYCTGLKEVYFTNDAALGKDVVSSSVKLHVPCSGDTIEQYAKNYSIPYEKASHTKGSPVEKVTKEATCTQKGTKQTTVSCTVCNKVIETKNTEIAALGHSAVSISKKEATCTEDGYTQGSRCSRCNQTLQTQTVIPATGHSFGSWSLLTTVTCGKAGSEIRTCTKCGYQEIRTTQVIEHQFTDWQITSQPTCTTAGSEKKTCTYCGTTETRSIAALGHIEVADAGYAATCTNNGFTDGTHCSRCHTALVKQETIPAKGHSYGNWQVVHQATCTSSGDQKRTCSVCGNVETQTISALGHTVVTDPAKDATCEESGLTQGSHCSRCSKVIVKQNTIAALGHDVVTDAAKDATCEESGLTQGSHCSRCSKVITKQNTIAALGHDVVTDPAKNATCEETGLTQGSHCSRCSKVITKQTTIAATGHTIVADKGYAATCTAKGLSDGSHCSTCNKVIVAQKDIAALGHDVVIDAAVAPSCGVNGLSEGSHCSRCNEVFVAQVVTASSSHTYGNWTITKAATCMQEGSKSRTCSNCHAVETVTIEKTSHSLQKVTGKAATCTENGFKTYYICGKCSNKFSDANGSNQIQAIQTIASLGHDYDEGKVVVEATCTSNGTFEKNCSRCDSKITTDISKKSHEVVVDHAVAATCTKSGLTEGSHCKNCNMVFVRQDSVAALGHNYTNWKTTKEATCTATGSRRGTCSRCGDVHSETTSKKAHTVVVDQAVAATCTETGLTQGSHCSVCNEVIVKQETTSKLSHKWDNGVVVKNATVSETGSKKYTCSICHEERFETIAKLTVKNGWYQLEDKSWMYFENYKAITGWKQLGAWYYFDSNGIMATGLTKIGSTYYFFNDGGAMQTGWQSVNGKWYYFNGGGDAVKGWKQLGAWYYFDNEGVMATGLQNLGGTYYYFDGGGVMQTGWQTINGKWYYFNGGGDACKGWKKIGSSWYYFDANSIMVTGLQNLGGTYYYFDGGGAMLTGWQLIGSTWYYFESGGAMHKGWLLDGKTWYYFDNQGKMVTGNYVINGTVNKFSSSGAWLG